MARGMIGNDTLPARPQVRDAEFVDEKFGKFIDAIPDRLGTRQPERIFSKQLRIPVLDHVRA